MGILSRLVSGFEAIAGRIRGRRPRPSPDFSGVINFAAGTWQVRPTPGAPRPSNHGATLVQPIGAVNYLFQVQNRACRTDQTVELTGAIRTVSGAPTFTVADPTDDPNGLPPNFRLIWLAYALGDPRPTARYWCDAYVVLGPDKKFSLSVPLDPARWSHVNGQRGSEDVGAFTDALRHGVGVGITFGGGYFYGHGVHVRGGRADLVLTFMAIR